jgi:hypothetical protein
MIWREVMPNWCENSILIQGDPEEVGKLLSFIESGTKPISFDKIIVMPPQLKDQSSPVRDEEVEKENIKLYGAKDWYSWATTHWGTKWDASNPIIIYDNTTPMMPGNRVVKMSFSTAWAPPIPVYKALAKLFPNTNIYATYNEPGVGFSGWEMYKEGKLVKKEEYDMSPDSILYYLNADEEIFAEV